MARPKNPDRGKVKSVILTLKLSAAERKRLRDLVAHREQELRTLTGQQIDLSASAYLRWLMDEDAVRRGLAEKPTKVQRRATRRS